MAEYSHSRIQSQLCTDQICNLMSGSTITNHFIIQSSVCFTLSSLCYDYHKMGTPCKSCITDLLRNIFLKIPRFFRNQNGCCTCCNTDIQCQITCSVSHDLDNRASLMRLHRVTDLIDCFYRRIRCCVVSYTIVAASDIIINCTRYANYRDRIFRRKCQSSGKCTVTTDCHNSIQSEQLTVIVCFLTSFLGTEFITAGCVQHCTTLVDNMRHIHRCHTIHVSIDQSMPSATDTYYFNSHVECCTHYGTYSRIHTWCVATGSQYSDPLNRTFLLLFHPNTSFRYLHIVPSSMHTHIVTI